MEISARKTESWEPIPPSRGAKVEPRKLGVSNNRGTPKSSILIGFSLINHPFWGNTHYFWKHPNSSAGFRGVSMGPKHPNGLDKLCNGKKTYEQMDDLGVPLFLIE